MYTNSITGYSLANYSKTNRSKNNQTINQLANRPSAIRSSKKSDVAFEGFEGAALVITIIVGGLLFSVFNKCNEPSLKEKIETLTDNKKEQEVLYKHIKDLNNLPEFSYRKLGDFYFNTFKDSLNSSSDKPGYSPEELYHRLMTVDERKKAVKPLIGALGDFDEEDLDVLLLTNTKEKAIKYFKMLSNLNQFKSVYDMEDYTQEFIMRMRDSVYRHGGKPYEYYKWAITKNPSVNLRYRIK